MEAEPESLVQDLSSLMEAHGVPFHVEEDWVVPYGELPAVRATWYSRPTSGRLDVDVLLTGGDVIHECFAGFGAGEVGKGDGMRNFCINSFHVLLAAFWRTSDPDQVTSERWQIGDRAYAACIGNFGTRAGMGAGDPEVPKGLFEAIEAAIKGETLTRECYWARLFFADVKGQQTFESLLNNESWEAGLQALKSFDWPRSSGYQSVRNFLVLRAVPD